MLSLTGLCSAATHEVEWTLGMTENQLCVAPGDVINFNWVRIILCFVLFSVLLNCGVEVTHHNVWEVATEQDWLDCANFPDGATVPEDGPLAWEVTCVACRVVGALVCRCRPRRAWCTWCAGWAPTAASATRSWR